MPIRIEHQPSPVTVGRAAFYAGRRQAKERQQKYALDLFRHAQDRRDRFELQSRYLEAQQGRDAQRGLSLGWKARAASLPSIPEFGISVEQRRKMQKMRSGIDKLASGAYGWDADIVGQLEKAIEDYENEWNSLPMESFESPADRAERMAEAKEQEAERKKAEDEKRKRWESRFDKAYDALMAGENPPTPAEARREAKRRADEVTSVPGYGSPSRSLGDDASGWFGNARSAMGAAGPGQAQMTVGGIPVIRVDRDDRDGILDSTPAGSRGPSGPTGTPGPGTPSPTPNPIIQAMEEFRQQDTPNVRPLTQPEPYNPGAAMPAANVTPPPTSAPIMQAPVLESTPQAPVAPVPESTLVGRKFWRSPSGELYRSDQPATAQGLQGIDPAYGEGGRHRLGNVAPDWWSPTVENPATPEQIDKAFNSPIVFAPGATKAQTEEAYRRLAMGYGESTPTVAPQSGPRVFQASTSGGQMADLSGLTPQQIRQVRTLAETPSARASLEKYFGGRILTANELYPDEPIDAEAPRSVLAEHAGAQRASLSRGTGEGVRSDASALAGSIEGAGGLAGRTLRKEMAMDRGGDGGKVSIYGAGGEMGFGESRVTKYGAAREDAVAQRVEDAMQRHRSKYGLSTQFTPDEVRHYRRQVHNPASEEEVQSNKGRRAEELYQRELKFELARAKKRVISTESEYARLRPGTLYTDARDGKIKRKE